MINPLDKEEQIHTVVPNMEQRASLSSNKDVILCSILGSENAELSNEILLAQLAELIVEAYFYDKKQSKR
jgi:hypothetical protein